MNELELNEEIMLTERGILELKRQYKQLLSPHEEAENVSELQIRMNKVAENLQIMSEYSLQLRKRQRELLTKK